MSIEGPLRKMKTAFAEPVRYWLRVGEHAPELNPLLGAEIALEFTGTITCIVCGRRTKKSYQQGYCYPCMRDLPETDSCVVKPETCHFAQGSCRDEAWGQTHCMQPHTVYLANSSGLKVGITRGEDPRGRWIDQGAVQGLAIRAVQQRLDSGKVEVALKEHVADRTNWRVMLKGTPPVVDLVAERDRLLQVYGARTAALPLLGQPQPEAEAVDIRYPVQRYPEKPRSHNFDKEPRLEGTLQGIKGQYLMLGDTVLNVRKFAGYHVRFEG